MKKLSILFFGIILCCCCSFQPKSDIDFSFYKNYDSDFSLIENNSKTIKNVIFLIGDGMGKNQIKLTKHLLKVDNLNMEKCTIHTSVTTANVKNQITDSAAAATALACGVKTINGYVGIDKNKNELKSILKIAQSARKKVGVAVTVPISHATPAGFLANNISRNNQDEITAQITENNFDVLLGGGKKYWTDNFQNKMKDKGYSISFNKNDLSLVTKTPTLGIFADNYFSTYSEDEPTMLDMTKKSLELLESSTNGFFIMIEGSQIDSYCHDNSLEFARQLSHFDLAVAEALKFAVKNQNTLVIVTADHETGGLKNNIDESFYWTKKSHSLQEVDLFVYGPNAQLFSNVTDNTEIFKILKENLQ